MAEVMARGPNFLYTREYVVKNFGQDTWNKIIASLPPGASEVWGGALLISSSYPFVAFKEFIAALLKVTGGMKDSQLAKVYEYIADQSLNKVYKIFFMMTNPSFVIRNYPKLWDKFFETGKVEVPLAEKSHAIVKFTLPEIFLDWLPPACLGYSKKATEMAGGKNLRMKEHSRNRTMRGDWEISYELNWDE